LGNREVAMRSFAEILERRAEADHSCEKSEGCEKRLRPAVGLGGRFAGKRGE
jgi:hypothetical protein